MSIYLVLVLVAIPGYGGEVTAELTREWITASSAKVCQAHADKKAAEQAQKVKGRVFGICVLRGEMS